MVIVKIQGGLGNQMFQYAFGKALAAKFHDELIFDLSAYKTTNIRSLGLPEFGLELNELLPVEHDRFFEIKNRILNKLGASNLGSHKVHFEKEYKYYPITHNPAKNIFYFGYWQSPLYFENIADQLKKEFSLPDFSLPKPYLDLIAAKTTVAIHVRKGDYLEPGNARVHHNLSLQYYIEAVERSEELAPGSQYLVFSDDTDWVIENFKLPVQWQPVINSSYTDVQMMMLMSRCRHQIIANSSYSWWAAWLNPDDSKHIIAPKNWFNNGTDTPALIPENWISI